MNKALALAGMFLLGFTGIQISNKSLAKDVRPQQIALADRIDPNAIKRQREQTADVLLRDRRDAKLQAALNTIIADMKLQRVVNAKKVSFALVDITNINAPRFAGVNSDVMLYAASLPKIAILFGFFKRVEQGSLPLSKENVALAEQMIRFSSNTAATELFHKVGMRYLADLLQSPEYRLYEKTKGGGLWVGKEYGKNAAVMREPLKNLSHAASAIKVARFYYLLETNRLVNPELTKQMKAILANPGIHHKFVKGLDQSCPAAEVMRKSGTWQQWNADSAIISHGGKTYIAVAIVEDSRGGEWLPRLIQQMDKAIFQGVQETGCRVRQ